jgi:hypothetical protein
MPVPGRPTAPVAGRAADAVAGGHNAAMAVTLLAAFAITMVASAAQAITGFGFALLAVPLLALVTPIETAVVAGSLASLALTAGAAWRERHHVEWPAARVIMLAALLGMPAGAVLLDVLPGVALTAIVGFAVLVSTWLVWRRPALPAGRSTNIAVGVLVGLLTTSTGTNGPPLVAAFQSLGYPPRRFRATIAAIFTGCGIVAVALFAVAGQLTVTAWQITAAGLPGAAIGWWSGDHVFRRIDAARFRYVVLGALVIASTITIVRAFT